MPKIEVFDPPMCCSTGVCGPSVDPSLVRFAADLDWLKAQGVEVTRFNLAQDPAAFIDNRLVADTLRGKVDALPLLLVDGVIASQGNYPDRDSLAKLAHVNGSASVASRARESSQDRAASSSQSCCGPASDTPVALGAKKKCC